MLRGLQTHQEDVGAELQDAVHTWKLLEHDGVGNLTEEAAHKLSNDQHHGDVQTHDAAGQQREITSHPRPESSGRSQLLMFVFILYRSSDHTILSIASVSDHPVFSHPYPARKPRLGGLTLSLKMTMRRTPQDGSQPSTAMSHHSWEPLLLLERSLFRDSVMPR